MAEVTRLLSNLLKSINIKCDSNEKKVIDYNALITEKIAQIQKKMEQEQDIQETGGEFIEGIDAESVEMLLDEDSNVIKENEAASARADEIIALAQSDADAIIEQARQECESIRQAALTDGRDAGYQEGKVQAAKEIEKQTKLLAEEKERLNAEYEAKLKTMEGELVSTILEVFTKVTHVLAEDKKDLVFKLVEDVIAKNEFSSDLMIRVSSTDYKFVLDNREKLRQSIHGKMQIEIIEDPTFKKGQCMIETDSGIYDCSLDIQMENLVESIKILACMTE